MAYSIKVNMYRSSQVMVQRNNHLDTKKSFDKTLEKDEFRCI